MTPAEVTRILALRRGLWKALGPTTHRRFYRLVDRLAVPTSRPTPTGDDELVQQDHILQYWITTIFVGADLETSGPPLPFLTMIVHEKQSVDGEWDRRTSTWEQALAAHRDAMAWVITKVGS